MARPDRRQPELRADAAAGDAVAPDDEHQPNARDQRVQALPSALAHRRDPLASPAVGEDAHRMRAEEQQQSDDEYDHGLLRADSRPRKATRLRPRRAANRRIIAYACAAAAVPEQPRLVRARQCVLAFFLRAALAATEPEIPVDRLLRQPGAGQRDRRAA